MPTHNGSTQILVTLFSTLFYSFKIYSFKTKLKKECITFQQQNKGKKTICVPIKPEYKNMNGKNTN